MLGTITMHSSYGAPRPYGNVVVEARWAASPTPGRIVISRAQVAKWREILHTAKRQSRRTRAAKEVEKWSARLERALEIQGKRVGRRDLRREQQDMLRAAKHAAKIARIERRGEEADLGPGLDDLLGIGAGVVESYFPGVGGQQAMPDYADDYPVTDTRPAGLPMGWIIGGVAVIGAIVAVVAISGRKRTR